MSDAPLSRAHAQHLARLSRTIRDLNTLVAEQEKILEKLKYANKNVAWRPSTNNNEQMRQLGSLKAAYAILTPREPYLPADKNSPIPGLLAIRGVHCTVSESRECLVTAEGEHTKVQNLLSKEEADLRDARMIATSIEARASKLRGEIQERTQKTSSQIGQEMLREMKGKKSRYESDIKRMVNGFNDFMEQHLAQMLAVEEMGGPVVGDMVEVDELTLEGGFNSQGRAKKAKRTEVDQDRRQRRIDEIWGQRQDGPEGYDRDEKTEALKEMRDLTENLMNALVEGETGGEVYVRVQRESAASRFLIRSKIAQLHPKDAKMLKLVDFGRDLDD